MKYFWFMYSHINAGGTRTYVEQVNVVLHPFASMRELRAEVNNSILVNLILHNWREITDFEYKLFKESLK